MAGASHSIKPDRKLGLCLAGGGGIGFLHIGLFEAMEELGIRPGFVAGTSSGAVAGALYASGKTSSEMKEIFGDFRWGSLVSPAIPVRGLMSTSRMQALYQKYVGKIDITDLPIPMRVAAMDLHSGELVGFVEGPLAKILAAGCCMPGIFQPVKIGSRHYYDAGGIYNLPLELMNDQGLDTIIAANTIGEHSLLKNPKTVGDCIHQAYLIRCRALAKWRTGSAGWPGRKSERLVLIDYDTGGANPNRLDECKSLIVKARELALRTLEEAFGK
jgi:NTE family protein